MRQMQNEVAHIIKEQCIIAPKRAMHGKAAGTRYDTIFQLYNATDLHILLYNTTMVFFHLMEKHDIDVEEIQLVGRMWSSLPLLGAMSIYLPDTNIVFIRRERKRYGPNNVFEGKLNKKPALIVDDVANSTTSFMLCQRILIGYDIPVLDQCFAIMNKKRSNDPYFKWDKYSSQEILSVVSRDMVD